MVPSGVKIGKEQLTVLAYADYIVLTGKNEIEIRHLLSRNRKHCQKVRTTDKARKKNVIVEQKNSSKQNKIGRLTIRNNYKFVGALLWYQGNI